MNNNALKKQKLLLITKKVSDSSAQGVRYLNLFENFKNHFELYNLTYGKSIFPNSEVKNLELISIFERIFGYFISGVFRKIGKIFLFPDYYIALVHLYFKKLEYSKNINFDVIIIGVTPFSLIRLNPILKKLFPNALLVNDFSDPFSANAEYSGKRKLIKKAIDFEKNYLPFADVLIVLNNRIRDYYFQNFNFNAITIEQGLNELFTNETPKLKIDNFFNLAYAGNFYKNFRDPERLFEAINISRCPIKFTIYGGKPKSGKGYNYYKFIINKPYLSQNKLVVEYTKAHLLIVIDNFYGIQVPGKTLECFSFNRPVLLIYNNPLSPTLEYIKNTLGVFIVENDKKLIKEKIEYIFDNYSSIQKKFDYKQFLWETLSKKYLKQISKHND